MKTIVAITQKDTWEKALETGKYTQSTLDSTLEEVGFIHCSTPDQTLEIANRKYTDYDDLILVYIDAEKVKAPIKFEGAKSGRAGIFPHIYGPLNTDGAYQIAPLTKTNDGTFEVGTPVPL